MVKERRYTIVIADDDPDDHYLVKQALNELDSTTETTSVYNGLQLLDLLLRRGTYKNMNELPDVILLDINMPLLDGFEALKEIRKHRELSTIPVYIMSTSQSNEDRRKAIELGATGYYQKPANFKNLVIFLSKLKKSQPKVLFK